MQRRNWIIGAGAVIIVASAHAQTVTASGAYADYIPLLTGTTTISDSIVRQYNGDIGVNVNYPNQMLQVGGNILAGYGSVGAYLIPDYGGSNGYNQGLGLNAYFDGTNWILPNDGANSAGALILGNQGAGDIRFYTFSSQGGVNQTISQSNVGNYQRMIITNNGSVGIGTTSPGARLELNGNLKLTSGTGASITFADNTVQSTAWTGTLCGGDYAESMDVSGDRTKYEPGDVLQLDPNSPGNVLKVIEPYSTLVAGIYSTKPGVLGRRQTTDPKASTTEVPMAMVGVVPTKVSTENGPIKIGDLLVTSSTPGHAMKGTDRTLMLGAVVGKAMGNLQTGTGVIEVLVTLQ